MALLPAKTASKQRLFAASRPNYNDYHGPADGDYVRYVEGLMAWAEQEQLRQRLKPMGASVQPLAAAAPDSAWGRSPAPRREASAEPGSVDAPMERLKRKAQAHAAKLQQQAAHQGTAARSGKKSQGLQFSMLVFIGALIVLSIFAPDWLGLAIVAWVAFSVFRMVRAASRGDRS